MFKFIHCADVHLDSPLKGLERYPGAPIDEIRLATRLALEELVSLAQSEKVDFVLVAGDLFDGDWKDYNTGLFFARNMARLREAGIRVVIVAGNHDADNKMTRSLRWPDNVKVLSSRKPESFKMEDLRVVVHGQSFATAAVTDDLSSAYPAPLPGWFNIGILHTSVNGREGHEPYAPCALAELQAKNYDYWALGHVHKREVLSMNPPVVFPGNIQGRHIREDGPKGCMLVGVDDRGGVSLSFEPLDVLRWTTCRVDAGGFDSMDGLLEALSEEIGSALDASEGRLLAMRVEFFGTTVLDQAIKGDLDQWTNQVRAVAVDCAGGRVWVEKVKFLTRAPSAPASAEEAQGPLAELSALVSELRGDSAALSDMIACLADLKAKLPPELKSPPGQLGLDNPLTRARMLEEAESLLLARLLAGGRGS